MGSELATEELPEGFTPLQTLGSGTMGSVHLARRDQDGRLVALKVVLSPHPILAARLRREADILAKVRHPHLPELIANGSTPRGPWLAMEYVAGSSLDLLKPDRRDALLAMMQVGGALEALHRVNLLHRDVKPANILQDEDGRVVLADLGLALDPDRTRLTETGLVGSPAFLAPEILDGTTEGSPHTDWYAWGMSLYWLLEGRFPIDLAAFEARLGNEDAPWPVPTFSQVREEGATAELVRRCLAEDPLERPTTVAEARAILRRSPRPGSSTKASTGAMPLPSPTSTGALPCGAEEPRARWRNAVAVVLAVGFGLGIGTGGADAPAAPSPLSPSPAPARPTGGETPRAPEPTTLPSEPAREPTPTPAASPAPAGTPGSELSPAPPTPPPPSRDFPLDALARLETILDDPEGYAIGRTGKLIPVERIAQEDLAVLDLDPRSYGARLRALPGVRDFFDWLAAGGIPEELPTAVRARLQAADEVFRTGGLLPPFEPFLEAAPAAPMQIEAEDWGALEVRHRAFEGWAAGAAADYREALSATATLEEVLTADPEAALRIDLPDEAEMMALFEAEAFLVPLLVQKGIRIRVAEYLREAVQSLRRAIYCAGRALAEGPGRREDLAVFFGRATTYANLLFHAELASLDAGQLLGRSPVTPADYSFVGDALRKGLIFHGHMGADQAARAGEMPAHWARAMGEDSETTGTEEAAKRWQRAFSRLIRFLGRWDQHQGIRELLDEYRPSLEGDPAQVGREPLLELATHLVERAAPQEVLGDAEELLVRRAVEGLLVAEPHRREHDRKLMRAYESLQALPPRAP